MSLLKKTYSPSQLGLKVKCSEEEASRYVNYGQALGHSFQKIQTNVLTLFYQNMKIQQSKTRMSRTGAIQN